MLIQKYINDEPELKMLAMSPSLSDFINQRVEVNRQAWYAAEDKAPRFTQVFNLTEKRANQKRLNEQLDWLSANINKPFPSEESRSYFGEAAGHRLKVLGMSVLGLTFEQLSVFEKEGIISLSQQFFDEARKFDPNISIEDIFQASRNIWTATYLQILLGLEAKLTPAIFGYSMLYPVTDNFLDDPKRTKKEKVEFNEHFCAWLKGESVAPTSVHEEAVLRLIQMIEGQYPRQNYPQVYESLLAIFYAQQESMLLPCAPVPPYSVDVLGITLRKGGTSVLTDGVLAAGELTLEQMEAIFDYGCFAQFMDDQEDVDGDLRTDSLTLFSEAARHGKLDRTMNRLFNYSKMILQELDRFMTVRSAPLIQVSLKGIDLLLIDACARTRSHYSRGYLGYLEEFFPVSYASLNQLNKQIRRRKLSLERLMQVFNFQL
ncbi:MAG: hypothetical protein AB9897_09670 [Anaerolineaceae bacterium]